MIFIVQHYGIAIFRHRQWLISVISYGEDGAYRAATALASGLSWFILISHSILNHPLIPSQDSFYSHGSHG